MHDGVWLPGEGSKQAGEASTGKANRIILNKLLQSAGERLTATGAILQ